MEDTNPESPAPPTTLRRNPPRRARNTPFVPTSLTRFNAGSSAAVASVGTTIDFSLADDAEPASPPPSVSTSKPSDDNLNVYLRIRPLQIKPQPKASAKINPRARSKRSPQKTARNKRTDTCLSVTGPRSVTLTIPKAKLVDSKRGTKNEVYDGFSFVFPPDSQQNDVYEKVMDPLVSDFIGGKSALLVAMGPTGSGKTHTMFGSTRDPGLVPLALKKIFSSNEQRQFYLAMVEIYSISGKGEKMMDLLSLGTELTLVQSTIKGLEEVLVSNLEEAERLVIKGMSKRTTAATDANSQSSRSQCIITIRRPKDIFYNGNDSSFGNNAVLMIADLAGAERERKTNNQGSRLGESNFINNTSMVFGLCLRSLLEHQKNPKKAFQSKHYKSSLLTRYLRDYLEGKKKMTLILTVKPGEDDYSDTSFVLRQSAPYMKIKYTNVEEITVPHVPKRSNPTVVNQQNTKRRKVVEKGNHTVEIAEKVIEEPKRSSISPKTDEKVVEEPKRLSITPNNDKKADENKMPYNDLLIELKKSKRNEEIMTNFARALWQSIKQYKKSKKDAQIMRESLIEKNKRIMELEDELNKLKLSQNDTILYPEIALESEITKGFNEGENSAMRAFNDLEEIDISSDYVKETVLCEDKISDEMNFENLLEQKHNSLIENCPLNQEKGNITSVNNVIYPKIEDVEFSSSNFGETNVAQRRDSISSLTSQEILQTIEAIGDISDIKCESSQDLKEENSTISLNLQETLQDLEDAQLDVMFDNSENMNKESANNEDFVLSYYLEQFDWELNSQLEDLNKEICNKPEELKCEDSSSTEEITTEIKEVKEEIEIQEEKSAIFEEKGSNCTELKQGFNSDLKEEIISAQVEEIKEEIIDTTVLVQSAKSESSAGDNFPKSDHSTPDENSSIERRRSRQPIENLIETIGKENLAASNPGKVNKPKRKLLPASSLMIRRELTGLDTDSDVLQETRGKGSGEQLRSEGSMSLIQLFADKPKQIVKDPR